MSENLSDGVRESALHFYDQLAKETEPLVKKSKYNASFIATEPTKNLKAESINISLNKPINKIAQKESDRKKEFRKRKRKKELKLVKEAVNASSSMQEPQNSNMDAISTEKSDSVSENMNIDLVNECEEIDDSAHNYEPQYILCKPQEDGCLFVTLRPNSKLYLIGYYRLQVMLGNACVLGYKFKKDEKHVVYSPASHSILSINCFDGFQVKKLEIQQIKDLGIPLEYVQDLNISTDEPVVILKLNKYNSNFTRLFDESQFTKPKNKIDVSLWKETLDVQIIEDPDNCSVSLLKESEEWSSYIEEIQFSILSSNKRVFVITGGKNVGKSTFLKYIINKFLSFNEISHVACLDLDPGQPEFSLPSCLTLSVCSSPLLGPSFSHHESSHYSYQNQILFGDVCANHLMNEYLTICSHLYSVYQEKFSDLPLLVNTMGFTASTGYDIMIDILRILEPTHVINIESLVANNNYPTRLTPEVVSSTNRGIFKNNSINLNYNLTVFKSISKLAWKSSSKVLREMNIMGYLSLLWGKNEKKLTSDTLKKTLIINWRRVAIHIHRSSVHPSLVMLAINGSLVALCSLGKEFLYKTDYSHPLQIQYNMSSLLSCMCVGWGVVRGIDPITQEIHIFTPLDSTELRRVNVIAMPNVQLPVYFRNFFATTSAPYVMQS